jgi:acetyl-CoA carboxylase biotin carboxylase subunit
LFNKVLIANRGEIACRIIHTCRKLGIKTVSIYSEADRHGLHVRMADEAYFVGEAPPQASYLDMDRIIEVAKKSGAEALHPGYGFLSENSVFSRRCQESNICFIGPAPEVMEKMGDKMRARKLAKNAGLPVLPGTDDAMDTNQAMDQARMLGFPLMAKAAEGGGGIGIHVIRSLDELESMVERTSQVASDAFGSSRIYFERFLEGASHIEVQLIGDGHGHVLCLSDRDCSIQRRNQKLVEESPATKLTPRLRKRICRLAVTLAQRIGYTNAGTIEFLLSPEGQLYFLEMNTRLQVEHGVTEMVIGKDIVEMQLRVAAGEELQLNQEDIQVHGHAVEARIYPEDPENFIPEAGTITDLHIPSGEHIRVDTALYCGYEVTLHYEPLLAKVMAWGENREEAVKRLLRALLAFRLEGVKCNIPLLRDVLAGDEFADAVHHTGSLVALVEERKQQRLHMSQNGHMNGNGKVDQEIITVISAALALALKGFHSSVSSGAASKPWRFYGRRQQMLTRTLGNRSWR